jgi:hypothetical protein
MIFNGMRSISGIERRFSDSGRNPAGVGDNHSIYPGYPDCIGKPWLWAGTPLAFDRRMRRVSRRIIFQKVPGRWPDVRNWSGHAFIGWAAMGPRPVRAPGLLNCCLALKWMELDGALGLAAPVDQWDATPLGEWRMVIR